MTAVDAPVQVKAMPGQTKDCDCLRVRHEHGTRNAYAVCGCRCRLCRDAAALHQRRVYRERAIYGPYRLPAPTVDEIAIERACHGDRVRLTADEVQVVFERLVGRGLSDGEVGSRLGVSATLVQKWRAGRRRPRGLR